MRQVDKSWSFFVLFYGVKMMKSRVKNVELLDTYF